MVILCRMPYHKIWHREYAECEYGDPYGPCARKSFIRMLTGKQLSHSENDIAQEPRKFFLQPLVLTHSMQNCVMFYCEWPVNVLLAKADWHIYPKKINDVLVKQRSCTLLNRSSEEIRYWIKWEMETQN